MLVVETRDLALVFMVIGILMLGTWPAVWNFVERKGRHPGHTFIDYGIAYTMTAVVIAMICGQVGSAKPGLPNISEQITESNGKCVAFAVLGGFILSIGNICLQYTVALLGLSVGVPFICALTIIVGVSINYKLDSGLNDAAILFPGVACAFVAVMLGGLAHIENQQFLRSKGDPFAEGKDGKAEQGGKDIAPVEDTDIGMTQNKDKFLSLYNPQRAIKAGEKPKWLGILTGTIAGVAISLFSPLFNIATNDNFGLLPPGTTKLSVWLANLYFGLAFGFGAVALNVFFLYYPPFGTAPSSISAYLKDHKLRGWAFFTGFLCSSGNLAEFLGGQAAGYAAAAMVQAFPLVGTLWGILLFKEFWGTSKKAILLLVLEICFYIAAMSLLGASAKARA